MRLRLGRNAVRGQSLVEFALVFPLFMLLLFGLIDLGRYVFVVTAFNQAAREATRFGSVEQWSYSCPAGVSPANRLTCSEKVARNTLVGGPAYFTTTATCTTDGTAVVSSAACRAGYLLKVVVQTPTTPANQRFTFFTPLIGNLIGPVSVSAQSQVIVQ